MGAAGFPGAISNGAERDQAISAGEPRLGLADRSARVRTGIARGRAVLVHAAGGMALDGNVHFTGNQHRGDDEQSRSKPGRMVSIVHRGDVAWRPRSSARERDVRNGFPGPGHGAIWLGSHTASHVRGRRSRKLAWILDV